MLIPHHTLAQPLIMKGKRLYDINVIFSKATRMQVLKAHYLQNLFKSLLFSTECQLMWFIGLIFYIRGPGSLSLTLTYEIQIFINSGELCNYKPIHMNKLYFMQ